MSIPSVNIHELHVSIKAQLAARFPEATVDFYPRPGAKISTPGILLELEDMPVEEPGDLGTEQVPVILNFNAYAVLDYRAGNKEAVKSLAGAIMAAVKGKRWGQAVSGAVVGGASPDTINGKDDDYEVMRVEFSHQAILGEDTWTDIDGVLPWKVYLGIAPDIGPDHIDDYQLIYEGESPPEL